jgi:hypothetical protein
LRNCVRKKGPHFFDAQHFPSIRFTSTKLTKLSADRAEFAGTLTFLSAARPVSFLIQFLGADRDIGTGRRRLDFVGLGIIRRSEFGMDFLESVVRDEVHVLMPGRSRPQMRTILAPRLRNDRMAVNLRSPSGNRRGGQQLGMARPQTKPIGALDSALEYICSHPDVWRATGWEIVQYYLSQQP